MIEYNRSSVGSAKIKPIPNTRNNWHDRIDYLFCHKAHTQIYALRHLLQPHTKHRTSNWTCIAVHFVVVLPTCLTSSRWHCTQEHGECGHSGVLREGAQWDYQLYRWSRWSGNRRGSSGNSNRKQRWWVTQEECPSVKLYLIGHRVAAIIRTIKAVVPNGTKLSLQFWCVLFNRGRSVL